jgi:aspartyl-tRNA(Asn)/glutamyl-tRNA(Gln) amidotransferase subunit A
MEKNAGSQLAASELDFKSAVQLRADIAARRVSPVEVVDRLLERIQAIDGDLNAYWLLNPGARKAAEDAEKALQRNERVGPLHGIPFSVKDLIATAGLRTTRGSAIFENWVPEHSAPAVERAEAAGGIVLGKTSTSEFGWKAVSDSPLFGDTRNPWNPALTPGGSSGGAAAAVAAGLGPLALATDAAGSARVPAAFCGVFGMKPSFGRIPVYPAPAADSLVHVGLITRTVRDCALLLSVVSGSDERDRNTLPLPRFDDEVSWDTDRNLRGLRAAWCPGFADLPVDPAVREACAAAVRQYQAAGLAVEEVKLDLPESARAFETLFQGMFGAQLVDALPKWRARMDPRLVEMVETGGKLSAYDLTKANMVRSALWEALRKPFEHYDILLLPVTGTAAFASGAQGPGSVAGVAAPFPQWLGYLYPFNLTGQPAASLPCGWTREGLPVGLQIVGRRFQDAQVLQAAAAFEAVVPWAQRTPPCAA